jgi:hypothetical protein
MNEFFESLIESDECKVVICNIEHTIIYLNRAAKKAYGNIAGKSIFDCHNERSNEMIVKVVDWFKKSENNNRVHTFYNSEKNKDVYMIALRDKSGKLIGYYEKHEYRNKDLSPFYNIY